MSKKEIKKLALDDLKRSGLVLKDYNKMGLVPCDEEQSYAVLNHTLNGMGYVLPYFNIDGDVVDFMRYRYLEDVKNGKGKVIRYSQPKNTGVRLYFPPCINWKKICKDTSITICFTEGEKKAYKASKEGIPTIGLGGVNSFINKQTKQLIDDFNDIKLRDRKVLICYDNDLQTNEDVNKASKAFAKLLDSEGAVVFNKLLPFNPYQKIGLDDYLVDCTVDEFHDLPEQEFSNITQLHEMNDLVAYIKATGKFYILDSDLFVNASHLKNDSFAHVKEIGTQPPTPLAKTWVEWSGKRVHNRLTYRPAQPKVTEDNEYNLWCGWGAIPEKGSIKPFMDAVNTIFDDDKELIKWFLDWVAYPIQYPATKMLTGVLIQSVEQGTGKSSLGLAIGSMYGDNYRLIDDAQLHAPFNEWAINKQFILGDEISGKDKRSESDKIKNLITRPDITINKKMQPTYVIPDCINYLFTSNHPDALSIEPDDRRFFVHRIKRGKGLTLKQGKLLEKFRTGKGKDHLLHYFIHEHKIDKSFDHRARPPMTEAKEELIDHSLTDVERFLTEVRDNPLHTLVTKSGEPITCDLYTTTDIVAVYEMKSDNHRCNTTAMGKALNKIFNHSDKKHVGTISGTKQLRALRNIEKWNKSTSQERQEHYDKHNINRTKRKRKSKIS